MKNIMMAVMVSVVSACYAGDSTKPCYTFTSTVSEKEVYEYQVKDAQGTILISHQDLNLIVAKYKPTYEQVVALAGQQGEGIRDLVCDRRALIEAAKNSQKIADEALKTNIALVAKVEEVVSTIEASRRSQNSNQ